MEIHLKIKEISEIKSLIKSDDTPYSKFLGATICLQYGNIGSQKLHYSSKESQSLNRENKLRSIFQRDQSSAAD